MITAFPTDGTPVIYLVYRERLSIETEAIISKDRTVKVRDYDSHVFICTGGDCKKRGAKDLRKAFKGELRTAGMNRDVRLDTVNCLGLCKHGPNAVVYPSGTWYLGLDGKDVPEVVEEHLGGGEPVGRLVAERRPVKARKK